MILFGRHERQARAVQKLLAPTFPSLEKESMAIELAGRDGLAVEDRILHVSGQPEHGRVLLSLIQDFGRDRRAQNLPRPKPDAPETGPVKPSSLHPKTTPGS